MNKKVFLDFGHGGKDPGALGQGLREKDINLEIGLKVRDILINHQVTVLLSRLDDTFLELEERARKANDYEVDVFASIHCNAFDKEEAQGLETYSFPGSDKGTALAKCIQDNLLATKAYTKDRGIKTANFAVLRLTKMPAVLTELAFITNKEDAKILQDRQDDLAKGVAKGILDYLGIKYVGEVNELYSPLAKEAMEWAIANGITDGSNPKESVSLERVITLMHRMFNLK